MKALTAGQSIMQEFLEGFRAGANRFDEDEQWADEHWGAYSRQLSDRDREDEQSRGWEAGYAAGSAYQKL